MMVTLKFKRQPVPDLTQLSIESDRLLLETVNRQYANLIFTEFTEIITQYMLPRPPEAVEETMQFIEASREGMNKLRELVCVVLLKSDRSFLGCCGLHARQVWPEPELGIWIKKGAHGSVYGREAVTAMAGWAFDHLIADYLIYPVDQANLPSRKIAESLGGIVFAEKKVPTARGTFLNEVVYRIPKPLNLSLS